MGEDKGDLWQLWASQRQAGKPKETSDESLNVDDLLKESSEEEDLQSRLENEIVRAKAVMAQKRPDLQAPTPSQDMSVTIRRPAPLLSGRLANHLAEQTPRSLRTKLELFKSVSDPLIISNVQEKAVLAMALVLTSHLTRFATTKFSEETITSLRDQILHGFDARESVKIEVEAYDLLNWFAGAMNPDWQMRQPDSAEVQTGGETSEKLLLEIIDRAIKDQRDLIMRYYTGSRGEFSERTITPIAVTAEKYLIAYCHVRGEERVFRLSRIVQLSPVNPDELSSELPMVYPSQSDTQLPPLPETPVDNTKNISKNNINNKKHDNRKARSDKSKKSKSINDIHENTKHKRERTLFDKPQKKADKQDLSETPSLLDYMKANRQVADNHSSDVPDGKAKK